MSEEEKTKINIMLKDRDIDNILERELSLDRYCYVHNYIASLKIEKDNLLEENKQLKEEINIYENPDDMTLMFMWCDEKAKAKIKDLQQRIDKAIEYIKEIVQEDEKRIERKHTIEELKEVNKLLEILGDKENE